MRNREHGSAVIIYALLFARRFACKQRIDVCFFFLLDYEIEESPGAITKVG